MRRPATWWRRRRSPWPTPGGGRRYRPRRHPQPFADLRFVADQLTAGPRRDGVSIPPGSGPSATRTGRTPSSTWGTTATGGTPGAGRRRPLRRCRAPPPGGGPPPPLLLTHGSADRTTPYSESTAVFSRVATRRWLLTLVGADHLPPVQGAGPWALSLEGAVLALLDTEVAGRAVPAGAALADAAAPGVANRVGGLDRADRADRPLIAHSGAAGQVTPCPAFLSGPYRADGSRGWSQPSGAARREWHGSRPR